VATEKAIRHDFHPKTHKWTKTKLLVKLERMPFSKGSLRRAYHLLILDPKIPEDEQVREAREKWGQSTTYVAKIAIDPEDDDRDNYFADVECQMYAKEWAIKFNEFNPPKKVDFIKAYILELLDRQGSPMCGVEPFIHGAFYKFNNNAGYVSKIDRNTPQAFSHFTYEASKHDIIICDIQGVGDLYTDPQIHSRSNENGFGLGNGAEEGITLFLKTHECNAICRFLRLPAINAKQVDSGTVPSDGLLPQYEVRKLSEIAPVVMETNTFDKQNRSCCSIL